MKKLYLLLALVCFSLVSCEKKGDVLKGTWKNVPAYNSSSSGGAEEYEMTFKFDGKGKFTYKAVDEGGFVWTTSKGTYTIEEHKTIVRLQGISTNSEGISHEFEEAMLLDLESKPATLTSYLYDNYGDLIMTLVFEKQ